MEDFQSDIGKTNLELRNKYINLARDKEAAAIRRKEAIRERAASEIAMRYPRLRRTKPNEYVERVTALTDIKCFGSSNTPADPIYKGAIEANRWYTNYAMMYGQAATGDAIRQLHSTIESLLRYMQQRDRSE